MREDEGKPLRLWPEGAVPGARGAEPPDVPTITPHLAAGGGPEPRAAIVVCPGGGYASLAPHEGAPVARWLNGLGVNAFVLRYRVAPYGHPWPLADAQRAIRTVRHRAAAWGVDPARVGILGFSAGGHLAATAATHFDAGDAAAADPVERMSSRPDLAILCYAVITLEQFRHEGSMRNLIGAQPTAELRRRLSAEQQVTADTPPAFLWHTADDAAVPVENSLLFAAALSRFRVPFALHVFERGRHGLGLAQDDPDVGGWTDRCALWLAGHGFGRGGAASA
jgi:acetyl esterase/lipase